MSFVVCVCGATYARLRRSGLTVANNKHFQLEGHRLAFVCSYRSSLPNWAFFVRGNNYWEGD